MTFPSRLIMEWGEGEMHSAEMDDDEGGGGEGGSAFVFVIEGIVEPDARQQEGGKGDREAQQAIRVQNS